MFCSIIIWGHEPNTDFWRIGPRIANRLAAKRIYTMGDMARATLIDEDWFYREFGVDGELMIDHAWGLESCTMADIKAFRPTSSSMSSGQVLFKPYPYQETEAALGIFRRIMPPKLYARQIHITFSAVLHDAAALHEFDLLIDHAALEREKRKQTAILNIREQYGKNAILTGTNFMDGATTRQRNEQIGGHRAG